MNDKKLFFLIILFVFIFEYKFIYMPGKKKLDSVNQIIFQKHSDKQLLDKLCFEYEQKKKSEEERIIRTADSDFSLFSYMGNLIEKQKIEKNITGIKPLPLVDKESFVIEKIRLNMENITLQQVYDFLYGMESSANAIYIPEFRMRRNRQQQFLLSAEMEILSIKTNER
ncbi:MAG TPA: hypothetical protein PKN36_02515 [bacterium]|nr:hypothetical protein [bacterium]